MFNPSFVASNQQARADNVITAAGAATDAASGTAAGAAPTYQQCVDRIRSDIEDFKSSRALDKVIVLWTANTERFSDVVPGVNDTADALLATIAGNGGGGRERDDEDGSGDESGDESEDESEDEDACEDDSEDVCEVECEAACEDDSKDEYCEVECEADSESGEESNNGSGEAESELKKVTVKMPRRIVATPKEHHHHHHRVHIALSGVSGSLVAAMCSPAGWTRHETLLDASWGDGLVLE